MADKRLEDIADEELKWEKPVEKEDERYKASFRDKAVCFVGGFGLGMAHGLASPEMQSSQLRNITLSIATGYSSAAVGYPLLFSIRDRISLGKADWRKKLDWGLGVAPWLSAGLYAGLNAGQLVGRWVY